VIAQRRAFPIATYLVYALTQLELRAQLLDNTGGMLKTHAALIRRDELLIAASFRPYAPEVVEVAADCHKRGVPVIAFTDTPVSPLAAAAKVRFDVGDNFALPFRSLVGLDDAAQALVIAIGYALKPAGRARGQAHLTTAPVVEQSFHQSPPAERTHRPAGRPEEEPR
jgi:adhesin HecA-like repeat protein